VYFLPRCFMALRSWTVALRPKYKLRTFTIKWQSEYVRGGTNGKEGKGKAVSVRAMKAYKGRRGRQPVILNFGTRKEVIGQLQAPTALVPRMNTSIIWIWSWVGPRAGFDSWWKSKISCSCQDMNLRSFDPLPGRYTEHAVSAFTVLTAGQRKTEY